MSVKNPLLSAALLFFLFTKLVAQNSESHQVINLGHQSASAIHSGKDPFNSTSTVNLNLTKFYVEAAFPIDARNRFYGESVYEKITVRPMFDFSSPMLAIHNKIKSDFIRFGSNAMVDDDRKRIMIKTTVEVLYPHVREFTNSLAKVRLSIIATLNDSSIIHKRYEQLYFFSHTERVEGESLVIGLGMSSDKLANSLTGIALGKVLDQFYEDLNRALNPHEEQIIISGKVINAATGDRVIATIQVKSDSAYSTVTTSDGAFNLKLNRGQVCHLDINSPNFVNSSEQLDLRTSELKTVEKDFELQPLVVGALVSLKNVLFYTGTTDLLEESYPQLDAVVAFLKNNPTVEIRLEGHTDNRGNAQLNLRLSQLRVDKIKSYLVSNGIPSRRVTGRGYGDRRPISIDDSEESHRLNRRVEFRIIKN